MLAIAAEGNVCSVFGVDLLLTSRLLAVNSMLSPLGSFVLVPGFRLDPSAVLLEVTVFASAHGTLAASHCFPKRSGSGYIRSFGSTIAKILTSGVLPMLSSYQTQYCEAKHETE